MSQCRFVFLSLAYRIVYQCISLTKIVTILSKMIEENFTFLTHFTHAHMRPKDKQTNRVWLSIKYTVWQQSYIYRVHMQYISRAACNSTIFEFTSIIYTWLSIGPIECNCKLCYYLLLLSVVVDSFIRSFVLYHCLFASLKCSSRINSLCALLFMLVRFGKTENVLPSHWQTPILTPLLYFVWAFTHIEQNPFTQ